MFLAGLLAATAATSVGATLPPLGFKPNIVFNLADDFGWFNSGWSGNSEARTPAIDALVRGGVILSRHYTFKYCSPTRSAFLSGRLPYHVNQANRAYSQVGGVDLRMTMVSEKLKSSGYATHQIGKWHAGSSCFANLPVERGFDSSYGYLGGSEGHFNQREGNVGATSSPVDLWVDGAPGYGLNGTYNAFAYVAHAIEIVSSSTADTPFFIYHAWQEAHVPNEVPVEFEDPGIDWPLRRTYEGMVHCLDSGIGNITQAIRDKGLYDKTLIVFSADNGGREDGIFGGNNYPNRGMKFTDFEGGTRVAAWISGGALPAAVRGTTHSKGLIHICDWYATFSELAGVDPTDAKAARSPGIPAIDSVSAWAAISSGAMTSRTTIVLSSMSNAQENPEWDEMGKPWGGSDGTDTKEMDAALITWPYKLVLGRQKGQGIWTGMKSPNATAVKDDDPGCPSGCLFNIELDPAEHRDLADQQPEIFTAMVHTLTIASNTTFQTNDTPGYEHCQEPSAVEAAHRDFAFPPCSNASTILRPS